MTVPKPALITLFQCSCLNQGKSVYHLSTQTCIPLRCVMVQTPLQHTIPLTPWMVIVFTPSNLILDVEGAVRLVGGVDGPNEGRVEIFHNGQWGTVCDDGWDVADAGVVCQQLGYAGATSAHRGAFFGMGVGPIWYDEFACNGSETNLTACPSNMLGVHDCNHYEDAGATCFRELKFAQVLAVK